MDYPKYNDIRISEDYDVYEFVSNGPKGAILKKIQFDETVNSNIYNLGFGDKKEDGNIDYTSESNNGDRDMILATVVGVVYEYTSFFPERQIAFFGSNMARTRLYRMAISNNIEFFNKDFHIFALQVKENRLVKIPFSSNVNCVGFLAQRKYNKNY